MDREGQPVRERVRKVHDLTRCVRPSVLSCLSRGRQERGVGKYYSSRRGDQVTRRGYGYPQITREDKERILGRNFADLMGIDLDAKRAELSPASA